MPLNSKAADGGPRCNSVPQNATPESTPTPAQLRAIAVLAAGGTRSEAAEAAGADRSTLYRWLRSDAVFVAELNRARQDQADALRQERRELAAEALKTIKHLVTSVEVPAAVRLRAALAALDAGGSISSASHGPTDPDEVRRQWANAENTKQLEDMLSGFKARPSQSC